MLGGGTGTPPFCPVTPSSCKHLMGCSGGAGGAASPPRCQHLARVRGGRQKTPPCSPMTPPSHKAPAPAGRPGGPRSPQCPHKAGHIAGEDTPAPTQTHGGGGHTHPKTPPNPGSSRCRAQAHNGAPPPPPPAPLGHTPPGGGRNVRSPWRGGENKFGVGGGGSKPPDHRAAPSGSRREPRAAMREGPSARGLPAPRSRSSPPIAPHRHPPGPPRPPGQAGRSGESGPGTPP